MAVAVVRDSQGILQRPNELVQVWKRRIVQAREARKPLERVWLSNLAFAAGRHWLVWDDVSRQMRHIQDMDPRYRSRTLYTNDRINEYMRAQLGEVSTGDDRPELLTVHSGETAEQTAEELNDAVRYAWDHEWHAQKAITRARSYAMTMGTSAIRMRRDPTKGALAGYAAFGPDGQRIDDPAVLQHLEQHGTLPDGSLPKIKQVPEGQTIMEVFTAFQLLTPPGCTHEDQFPWEIIVRPALLEEVTDTYPAAAGLVEDTDIASAMGTTTGQQLTNQAGTSASRSRLREHVWLYTGYRRPCHQYPDGQEVVIASNQYRLLDVSESLKYEAPDGTKRSGISYFHWWRLDDRFHSRAFIEPMKDPQRMINERETQNVEIIERGMPKVFMKEGAVVHNPAGLPMEIVELSDTSLEPHFFAGIGPGAWMYEDIAHHVDNLSHASTLSPLRLGENPANVKTYAQLATLNENELYKRSEMLIDHEVQKATLVENGVHDIKEFWPEEKLIRVAGDEGSIAEKTFRKSTIPPFFQVRQPTGGTQPRSQAAEIAKIDAIWQAAVATGVVTGPNGQKWVEWYAKSLDAAQVLDLPGDETDSQVELAHFENTLMLTLGELPEPADHDVQPVHIPIHHEALDQARAAGDQEATQRIQAHIDMSIQKATTARKLLRFADPADTNDTASDLALDEDQALRENAMMIAGEPLNPEELHKALVALQAGTNPETGKPATATDDLQGILERASLKPTLIENLEMHLDRHGKVVKSNEFLTFPPEVRQRFLTHFDQTRELYLSLPLMPDKMTPPHVTLALREGVGPTTTAQILRRAGVPEADPDTIAAEPSQAQIIEQIKLTEPPTQPPDADADTPPVL